MTKTRWRLEAERDPYRKMARRDGYRSRAAYKLLEANKRFNLIERGYVVVELGAWPGGMTQAAARIVGSEGIVVAVDKRRFREFSEKNIITLQLDILRDNVVEEVLRVLEGRKTDFLVSDASPSLSGIREIDILSQLELSEKAYEIALKILKRGRAIMLKAFESEEVRELESKLRESFKKVKRFIPKASKKKSSELYLIGLGKI